MKLSFNEQSKIITWKFKFSKKTFRSMTFDILREERLVKFVGLLDSGSESHLVYCSSKFYLVYYGLRIFNTGSIWLTF